MINNFTELTQQIESGTIKIGQILNVLVDLNGALKKYNYLSCMGLDGNIRNDAVHKHNKIIKTIKNLEKIIYW